MRRLIAGGGLPASEIGEGSKKISGLMVGGGFRASEIGEGF